MSIYIESLLFIFASSFLKPWRSPYEITTMLKLELIFLYNKYVTHLIPKQQQQKMVYHLI